MDWFEISTAEKKEKMIINADAIMSVKYNAETNLTIIDFIRSAYPSAYVRGNIIPDIKRLISMHGNYVTRIGE